MTLGICLLAFSCGPNERNPCDPNNVMDDVDNCGACGHACGDGETCIAGNCMEEACEPGVVEDCYSGLAETENVGTCHGGQRTCSAAGVWGVCVGEVVPSTDICGNGVDENCSGVADEDVDLDADGFTTCAGDCCDSAAVCGSPELVNPGAFESNGNAVDDDCDTVADNALTECDTGLLSNSADALDYARAMDLCQMSTDTSNRWGVLSATLTLANGSGVPHAMSRALRDGFGTGMPPQRGERVVVMSSGHAADMNDTNPPFSPGVSATDVNTQSPLPSDWMAANGNVLPNAPGCPAPTGNQAMDPVMLTLRIRVPSNAKSFSFNSNFFSHEYPEWTCTFYNDFFVALLDSGYTGDPANPADKNLAFYTDPAMQEFPIGVNLAYGNTGVFRECVNGAAGCRGPNSFQHTACTDTTQLPGTGFDVPASGACDGNAVSGGGTGWLTTAGNVVPGEIITLRIALWDTSDHNYDSTAIIDNFQWSVDAATPGTVIE